MCSTSDYMLLCRQNQLWLGSIKRKKLEGILSWKGKTLFELVIPSTQEVMFSPLSVCVLVGLFGSKITQKQLSMVKGSGMGQGGGHWILAWIRISWQNPGIPHFLWHKGRFGVSNWNLTRPWYTHACFTFLFTSWKVPDCKKLIHTLYIYTMLSIWFFTLFVRVIWKNINMNYILRRTQCVWTRDHFQNIFNVLLWIRAIELTVNKEWLLTESGIVDGCWTYNWPHCINCGPFMAPDLEKS